MAQEARRTEQWEVPSLAFLHILSQMVEHMSSERNGAIAMSSEKNKVLEPSTRGGPSRSGQTTPELREGHALRFMANVTRMLKAAGALAFVAAAQWVLLVIVAETQY